MITNRLLSTVFIVSLMTIVSSCAPFVSNPTAEYLYRNPAPQPDFVVDTYSSDVDTCIRISQRPFWNGGYDDGELARQIKESAVISINNRVVQESNVIFGIDSMYGFVQDDEGNVIGTYGGTIQFCTPIPQLPVGLHLINLTFSDLNDNEYSYSWTVNTRDN